MKRALYTWLVTAVVACVTWPGVALAEEPQPTVALEVDVSALPQDDETEGLRWLLVERQTRVLRDGGIGVVEDERADADAKIRVTVNRYGEGDVNYRFTVALLEDGAVTMERRLTCDLCRDTELVTKVGEEVARVSGRFVYGRVEGEGDGGQHEEGRPAPKVRRVGGAGWAGIAVAAAGLGFGVGGAIELAKPARRELTAGDFTTRTVTEPRRVGSTLLGVGVGLLVGGAVLIAIDQTVLLERRRSRARRATFMPSWSTTGVGLSWSGRF